ncbi:MAG: hypothetical protein JWP09_780 [Candidatus Taylorbacteria bacterium]|nr:hypothetical protein [Candidatus Taylorbacteria bacterium]
MSKIKIFSIFFGLNLISDILFPIFIYMVSFYLKIDFLIWSILLIPILMNSLIYYKGKFSHIYAYFSILFIIVSYLFFYFELEYLTVLALKNATFF